MWVLILTILTTEAPAVASVPGFASEAVCHVAGEAWKRGALETRKTSHAYFLCVKPGA
jgi:hypothetical protein